MLTPLMDEFVDGRALWDGFPDAAFLLDRTGRIQRENAAARRLTGFAPGRFLQDSLPEVFAEEFKLTGSRGTNKTFEFFWPAQEAWAEAQIIPEKAGVSVILRDITSRRQAEAADRDRAALLEALHEHSFDAVGVAVNGVHVFVNRAYLTLFGYERMEEVLDRPVFDLIAPAERDAMRQRVEGRQAGRQEALHYETRGLRRDGTEFEIEFRVSPYLRDEQLHTLVILRDVTARKIAENELRDSEARFRAIIERSGVGLWHVTPERQTLYCNPAMCKLLETELPEEIKQFDYHEFFPEHSRQIIEAEHQKRQRGEASSYEVDLIGLRGGRKRVQISGAPILGPQGKLESILGTFTDLTERQTSEEARRQAEEQYRSIFENAREGLFRTSPDGHILSANPALARMQGYASPEEMIADISDVGRQVYVDPTRRTEFLHRMQDQGQVTEFESQIYCRDGHIIWISESTRAITHENGQVLYYEGSSIDITARKTLEIEREGLLREAVQRAEHCAVTGLLNHRAFHRRLREETAIAGDTQGRLAVVALDMDNFKFFNDTYGHLAGDDVLRRVADALRAHCRASDSLARIGGDEFALLMPGLAQEEAEAVAQRLTQSLVRDGFCPPGLDRAVPLGLSAGVAVFPEVGPEGVDALHQADVRLLAAKRSKKTHAKQENARENCGDTMLDGLMDVVASKDRSTHCHARDVRLHSLLLAKHLELDQTAQETVTTAALLHDIGKIGIPNRILRKPGALSADEWEVVRQHPGVGAALVASASGLAHLPEIVPAIRHHHERWDGLGYPDGLRGEAIPLPARILAVAEAYAAMTTDRPYAASLPKAEARNILETGAGTQWDPVCVAAFLADTPTAPARAV